MCYPLVQRQWLASAGVASSGDSRSGADGGGDSIPRGKGQVIGLQAVVDGSAQGDYVGGQVAVGGRGPGHVLYGEDGVGREEVLSLAVAELARKHVVHLSKVVKQVVKQLSTRILLKK